MANVGTNLTTLRIPFDIILDNKLSSKSVFCVSSQIGSVLLLFLDIRTKFDDGCSFVYVIDFSVRTKFVVVFADFVSGSQSRSFDELQWARFVNVYLYKKTIVEKTKTKQWIQLV